MTKSELGDYQTPLDFAKKVALLLNEKYGLNPKSVLEPTIGLGSFVEASIESFSNLESIFGVDINQEYIAHTTERLSSSGKNISLECQSIFAYDFSRVIDSVDPRDDLLCIGNPPWVTNSQLSSGDSLNQPIKINFKKLRGIEAITGKSNFDIAEYILLKTMSEISAKRGGWYAFLVKGIVARNLFKNYRGEFSFSVFDVYHFDAMKVFKVACDAVLMVVKLDPSGTTIESVNEYEFDSPEKVIKRYGFVNGRFVSDVEAYKTLCALDGDSPIEWRQGIKHDCSKVMELIKRGDSYQNALNEDVSAIYFSPFVYPLVKSSDLKGGLIDDTKRRVIVTQKKPGESNAALSSDPSLWEYLHSHLSFFEKRKSIIYSKADKFAIFGIGSYSFCSYKVAVSGLYKEPRFTLIHMELPVMLDDTGYFVYTDDRVEAYLLFAILSSKVCLNFIKSISFSDSKRPFTKETLQRIEFSPLMEMLGFDYIHNVLKRHNLDFSKDQFNEFIKRYAPMPKIA